MLETTSSRSRNPIEKANVLNKLFFWWMKDLFWKGTHQDLEETDVYEPLKEDESEKLGDYLEKCWNVELKKLESLEYTIDEDGWKKPTKRNAKPRFYKAILRAFAPQFLRVGLVVAFNALILRPIMPIFQGYIIDYFKVNKTGESISRAEMLGYCTGMVLSLLGSALIVQHTNMQQQQIAMRVRTACSSLVYRKILRLGKRAMTQTAAGQVVNLLSNDMSRFDILSILLNFVWIAPIQLLVITCVMWNKVGVAALIGNGALLLVTLPPHVIFTYLSKKLRSVIAILTDQRVEMMTELITGIQVIKMYAWEKAFSKIVSTIRMLELRKIKASSYIRGVYTAIMVFTERLTLYVTVISFVLLGNDLQADVAYVLSTYYNILQLSVALYFPLSLILAGETLVTLNRIEEFLLLDEMPTDKCDEPRIQNEAKKKKKKNNEKLNVAEMKEISEPLNKPRNPVRVELKRVSANWTETKLPPTLCDVSIKIEGGQLCGVIGSVGSGKSSLLHVLLRELPLGAGIIRFTQYPDANKEQIKEGYITDNPNMTISYASQDPWIFNGSVRDNILFGQPYERTRYVEVTRACALSKDFQQLPQGDMTSVGERGAGLSGGQRARVNLARAVYRQADIYILDDPLSAVDTRVAKRLFKQCIKEYLKGKTRILVTHQLQFLKDTDVIVAMDHGTVKAQGTYNELIASNQDFVNMLNHLKSSNETKKEENETQPADKSNVRRRSTTTSRLSIKSAASLSLASEDGYDGYSISSSTNNELMEKGHLSSKVYKEYFLQGSSYFSLAVLTTIFLLTQVTVSGSDYWLSYWTNVETLRTDVNDSSYPHLQQQYSSLFNSTFLSYFVQLDSSGLIPRNPAIIIYTLCIFSCVILVTVRSLLFMKICMNASKNLHDSMFSNLLHATMNFFHTNPSGRILNRFSKDIGCIDELLPRAMLEGLQIFLVMIGIFIMEIVINYWLAIPILLLGISSYFLRGLYLKSAESIKRIEGVMKSPVFSHINTTMEGLSTIRSSGRNVIVLMQKEFEYLQDGHTGAWYLMIAMATTFSLALELLTWCFVTCVCYSFTLVPDETLSGSVGLAISQSLIITGMLQYGVKQSADVVALMVAVERIIQYTNLPKEKPLTPNESLSPNWPQKGRLVLRNVNMRYDPHDPPVLKNLNVIIEAGWKVGVVGRTGAGKSSLISALFRLFGEGLEGEIKIDDENTSNMSLQQLRSHISIIPQEPVLFSASLRYNLDPFNQYEDTALWEALREVELLDAKLDQKVMRNGSNFSVGQRQLICLARAILRNNRVLVLDEATANIDTRTDAVIQQTIRTKFVDCTVITIAHRLNTIIDSDRVIVMENGEIVEFGCPYELLRDRPTGYFSQMVSKTGASMAQSLYEQAEIACRKNTRQRSLELSQQNPSDSEIIASVRL